MVADIVAAPVSIVVEEQPVTNTVTDEEIKEYVNPAAEAIPAVEVIDEQPDESTPKPMVNTPIATPVPMAAPAPIVATSVASAPAASPAPASEEPTPVVAVEAETPVVVNEIAKAVEVEATTPSVEAKEEEKPASANIVASSPVFKPTAEASEAPAAVDVPAVVPAPQSVAPQADEFTGKGSAGGHAATNFAAAPAARPAPVDD